MAVAEGDLGKKIHVEAFGEMLELKVLSTHLAFVPPSTNAFVDVVANFDALAVLVVDVAQGF